MKVAYLFLISGLFASLVAKGEIETQVSNAGYEFTRITDRPKLGEAWKDPSGLIWGDLVVSSNGKGIYMKHKEAEAYCQSIGARLPSSADYDHLSKFFYWGRKNLQSDFADSNGFKQTILPHLDFIDNGGRLYWSSTPSTSGHHFYVFDSIKGFVGSQDYPIIGKILEYQSSDGKSLWAVFAFTRCVMN